MHLLYHRDPSSGEVTVERVTQEYLDEMQRERWNQLDEAGFVRPSDYRGAHNRSLSARLQDTRQSKTTKEAGNMVCNQSTGEGCPTRFKAAVRKQYGLNKFGAHTTSVNNGGSKMRRALRKQRIAQRETEGEVIVDVDTLLGVINEGNVESNIRKTVARANVQRNAINERDEVEVDVNDLLDVINLSRRL
jgi:hypothetical protein